MSAGCGAPMSHGACSAYTASKNARGSGPNLLTRFTRRVSRTRDLMPGISLRIRSSARMPRSRCSRWRGSASPLLRCLRKRIDQLDHPPALLGVRQTSYASAQVVDHVLRLARGWSRRRDVRVADHELEKELRPRLRVELGGPRRYLASLDPTPETRAAERRVGEHADLSLTRQRQDGRLDLA